MHNQVAPERTTCSAALEALGSEVALTPRVLSCTEFVFEVWKEAPHVVRRTRIDFAALYFCLSFVAILKIAEFTRALLGAFLNVPLLSHWAF